MKIFKKAAAGFIALLLILNMAVLGGCSKNENDPVNNGSVLTDTPGITDGDESSLTEADNRDGMADMPDAPELTGDEGEVFIVVGENNLSAQLFAFNTFMKITVYNGENGLLSEEELKKVAAQVFRLEKIFSTTDPESELYRINARTFTGEVCDDLEYVLAKTGEIYSRSRGALDPTAYPVVKAWGFTTDNYRVPSPEELADLVKYVDFSKVEYSGFPGESVEAESTGGMSGQAASLKLPDNAELDFGAIAKGYLSDVLVKELRRKGVTSAMLDLGGNIVTIGTKVNGNDWNIGIKDPNNTAGMVGYIPVADRNVITSGGYERFFTDDDGTVYWHIIDPATGYPAHSGVISATIIGRNGLMCDALSTALFVMGADRAAEYYKEYGGFEYVLVLEDGTVVVSEGIKDDIVLY